MLEERPVKNANKKPTMKQIAERVSRIETYLKKVINPNLSATMSMFEEYLDYKNDLTPFTERMSERVDEKIKRASEEGKTQQTEGSGTTEADSKNGEKLQSGDVEINGKFYGCKRRKVVPRWVLPEKQETGVVFRADRMSPYIAVPLEHYLLLISLLSDKFES